MSRVLCINVCFLFLGSVTLTQLSRYHPTQVEINLPKVKSLHIIEGDCVGGVLYNPFNVSTSVPGTQAMLFTIILSLKYEWFYKQLRVEGD